MPGSAAEMERPHSVDDELEDEISTRKSRFFKFFHKLHAGIVKDFTPLTQLALPALRPLSRAGSRPSPRPSAASMMERRPTDEDSSSPSGDEDEDEDDEDGASDEEEARHLTEQVEQAEAMATVEGRPRTAPRQQT